MKFKSGFKLKVFSLLIALSMAFSFVCPNFSLLTSRASISAGQSEIERPSSLEEGLSRKSLDEIRGKRVTIRQPQMKILQTGLTRTKPQELSNAFTFHNFETGEATKLTYEFSNYPHYGNTAQFSKFEKYLLLREVFWLNKNAMADAESGNLKKHPAADTQYDEQIEFGNNAVSKWILTDPEYKSPMTTGLYLAPGEVATVKVKGLGEGEAVTLYTHHQQTVGYAVGNADAYFKKYDDMIIAESEKENPNYEGLSIELNGQYERQLQEIPAMGAYFNLTENEKEYKIGCAFGGPLYINPTSSPVEITITGAVETPHFILGVTSPDEFEKSLRNAPGIIATLDCENGQLIGPAKYMRACDDIEKLAYFWHSVFAVNASFNGRAYNYDVTLSFDTHVPAGSAVALSSTRAAHPSSWFGTCMNYQAITTAGNWGVFHELGHIHASSYGSVWGMKEEKEGEVRNNTLIIIIYTMLCNMDSRMVYVEHGEFTHPYTTLEYAMKMGERNDYSDCNYFDMLSVYANLIHYFSPEVFVDFLYTYKLNSSYCNNARADFAYRFATVTNMNIVPWLNSCYKTNITNDLFSTEQLKFIRGLTEFYPIAYRYANGVNDNETARKYEVDFLNPTTFDFSGNNILCPVDFEIVSFRNPKYGKIEVKNNDQVTYTPPANQIIQGDEFAVRVRIKKTGVDVYLPVRFNFAFKSSFSKVWDDIPSTNMTAAQEFVDGMEPTYTETSITPGKARWTSPKKPDGSALRSYIESQFQFVATESGEHKFYLNSDDASVVYFSKEGEETKTLSITNYSTSFNQNSFVTFNLEKGETLQIKSNHINNGGVAYLFVGVKMPSSDRIVNIPNENMLHYTITKEQLEEINTFVWKPKFFVSIKNTLKKSPAQKTGWQVLEAPLAESAAQDKECLVDGKTSTVYHSVWSRNPKTPMPHIFVIDTLTVDKYNYFEITTRTNSYGNSQIYSLELYGSDTENNDESYKLLYKSEKITYENYRAELTFDETNVRYFKLKVNSTSGGSFTVIAELSAGISASMEQTIKPSTFQKENTGFEENVNGELQAKDSGSVFSFEFVGTGFQIFANTGENYGSAKITIDGDVLTTLSLDGKFQINKLVLTVEKLKSTTHLVKIETVSGNFNISFINFTYGVDTKEEPEPPKEHFDEKLEQFVNGHYFGEEVVPEIKQSSETTDTEPEPVKNKKVLIGIIVGLSSACALVLIGYFIYSAAAKSKAKKNKKSKKKSSRRKV